MDNSCYIVVFSLAPSENLTYISNAVKSYGTWAKINEFTWAIVTSRSAIEVRDHLSRYLTSNTSGVFVIKSGVKAAWRNVACKHEWLKKNL